MKFSEIIGQKSIIDKLLNSVRDHRVSHAQLFAGPEGNGKLALAIAFAQYICCENRSEIDPCGECRSCAKYNKLIHPDLHFVFPVFRKDKATDPTSNLFLDNWRVMVNRSPYFNLNQWLSHIGVENEQGIIYSSEAAEIIKTLSLKTYESDYKAMIIWLPEKMHMTTANKLLKMIEEPPEKTLFLLISEEPDLVLPTILSRCQFVRIPAIGTEELASYLVHKFNIDNARAAEIAHISKGNYLRAESLLNEDDTRTGNLKRFIELMRLSWVRDIISLAEWADNIAGTGREAQKRFLNFSLSQLRENLMLNLGQEANNLVFLSHDEAEFAKNFNKYIHTGNVEALANEITLAYSHVVANGNAKIIFLDLALKVTKNIR